MMKMMLSSFDGHSMIDIGTQAMAGIGRRISEIGKTISRTSLKRPMIKPSGTATTAAIAEADQDAAAAQHHVHEELGVVRSAHQAIEHLPGRGHVDEADVHVHPVFGQQVPGQQETAASDTVPTASARSCPRCSVSQRLA